ncbi:hypothetical protein FHS61_002868 [Altererythrobacter atlanticus]|jgi:hypothetical protein|uniref:hypothetical protein n=1 Tax=Croceibacterium atlanticum TaxID=1267766 RepID=UPI0006B370C7|nr:hypothetical protein [Croceibacterium atlanticum]MBB5733822.1 hypothetical protein [Croceibacterium atlanticum]
MRESWIIRHAPDFDGNRCAVQGLLQLIELGFLISMHLVESKGIYVEWVEANQAIKISRQQLYGQMCLMGLGELDRPLQKAFRRLDVVHNCNQILQHRSAFLNVRSVENSLGSDIDEVGYSYTDLGQGNQI